MIVTLETALRYEKLSVLLKDTLKPIFLNEPLSSHLNMLNSMAIKTYHVDQGMQEIPFLVDLWPFFF